MSTGRTFGIPDHRVRIFAALILGLALLAGIVAGVRPVATTLASTKEMLATTRAILLETRLLHDEVERVRTNLLQLERQDGLLAEQAELMTGLLAALNQQEQLATGATDLLAAILDAERSTVDLTVKADQAAVKSMGTVSANVGELERLAAATVQIRTHSLALDNQVGRLLVELDGSAENFAVVGRAKTASRQVTGRTVDWWQRIWEWFRW